MGLALTVKEFVQNLHEDEIRHEYFMAFTAFQTWYRGLYFITKVLFESLRMDAIYSIVFL